MAKDIVLDLDVNAGGGAKSLLDLKNEFKELQLELSKTQKGTDQYINTLQKLADTKDEIEDLREEIQGLSGAGKFEAFAKAGQAIAGGFAAAQGAAALFGSESEDLQKSLLKVQAAMALAQGIKEIEGLGQAFKVLGAVIKANPIFLIAGIIIGIGAALFALKDKIGVVGDAFEWIGEKIGLVIDKITEFTDFIGLSNSALTKQGEELTKSINSSTEALAKQTRGFDEQIAIAKASGKSTIDLEKAKLKAIIDTNKALVEQTIAYVRSGGELDEERKKLLTSQLEAIRAARVQEVVIEETNLKDRREKYKKYLEDLKKLNEEATAERLQNLFLQSKFEKEENLKRLAEEKAQSEAILKIQKDLVTAISAEEAAKADADFVAEENRRAFKKSVYEADQNDRIAAIEAERDLQLRNLELTEEERIAIIQSSEEKIRSEKQKTFDTNLSTVKQGLQATQALTDLYFGYQLKQAKGNADKEREIRKKQFNVNKAFGVANAVIDGVGAVQKALNNPYPLNLVLAVISGALAAANVIKIASAKFDDGGGSTSSDTGGALSSSPAPVIPAPNNTVTKINEDGTTQAKPEPQKVFVTEGDIRDSNKRVTTIEETAKF